MGFELGLGKNDLLGNGIRTPPFMTLIYERIGEQYAPIDQVYQLNKGEA